MEKHLKLKKKELEILHTRMKKGKVKIRKELRLINYKKKIMKKEKT